MTIGDSIMTIGDYITTLGNYITLDDNITTIWRQRGDKKVGKVGYSPVSCI